MNELTLPCDMNEEDTLVFEETTLRGYKGQLVVFIKEDGEVSRICLSPDSEARLYQYLSERRGITPPAEPDALTRIAVASERAADALEKLASFATDDVCDHGFTRNCPEGCC